ncbi:MAG TPA: cytochrome c, partial [Terriglobia bacterium]|nr:cytochrome c [Terriglobia bacterium]
MARGRYLACAGILLLVLASGQRSGHVLAEQQSSPPAAPPVSTQRAVVNRYCATCHNAKLKTADLLLDQADVDQPALNPEVWEKVVRKLRTRAMPPGGAPHPDEATYDALASFLESELDR